MRPKHYLSEYFFLIYQKQQEGFVLKHKYYQEMSKQTKISKICSFPINYYECFGYHVFAVENINIH